MTGNSDHKVRGDSASLAHIVLMNLWCYSLLLVWTLVGILVFLPAFAVCLLTLRWSADRIVRCFIWIYGRGWMLLMSPFVKFRRVQMEGLERGKPCLLVVNHLSFFDTYCMALLPVYDITFAVRSWPFKMFWYSGFMRLARYLDVEGNTWEETLSNSKSAFASGGTVLFFPEGHRSRDGQLQRFYSGGFKVAIESGVPVVPLCIDGTDRLLPPGRKWLQPCRVTLKALNPVETAAYRGADGHIQLRKDVKEMMKAALAEMRREVA